ncbi:Chaperone protein dnaJ A6, partial [Dictyocoela muelleri]
MLHYQRLGINKDATKDEIRAEYIKKTMITHPNRGGNVKTFADIKKSYEILINDDYSRAYNIIGDSEFKFNEYALLITGVFSKFNLNCLLIHMALLSYVILALPGHILFNKVIYLVPLLITSALSITAALINSWKKLEITIESKTKILMIYLGTISINLLMIFTLFWLDGRLSHNIVISLYVFTDLLISTIVYSKNKKLMSFYFTIIRISCVVSGLLLQNENVRLFSSV